MFFLLVAGLISNLIHGDVKPQFRLHLQSCLAAGLCLVPGFPFERETAQGIIVNVFYTLPLQACYAPDTEPSGDRRGGHTVHDSSYSSHCSYDRAHRWIRIHSQPGCEEITYRTESLNLVISTWHSCLTSYIWLAEVDFYNLWELLWHP